VDSFYSEPMKEDGGHSSPIYLLRTNKEGGRLVVLNLSGVFLQQTLNAEPKKSPVVMPRGGPDLSVLVSNPGRKEL